MYLNLLIFPLKPLIRFLYKLFFRELTRYCITIYSTKQDAPAKSFSLIQYVFNNFTDTSKIFQQKFIKVRANDWKWQLNVKPKSKSSSTIARNSSFPRLYSKVGWVYFIVSRVTWNWKVCFELSLRGCCRAVQNSTYSLVTIMTEVSQVWRLFVQDGVYFFGSLSLK